MSGNCATGIAEMAMMPASVMTIAMTKARRGRSMKMAENMDSVSRRQAGRDDLSWTHFLHPFDDYELAVLQSVRYRHASALLGAGRDPPQPDLLRRVDHQHIAAGLVDLHR